LTPCDFVVVVVANIYKLNKLKSKALYKLHIIVIYNGCPFDFPDVVCSFPYSMGAEKTFGDSQSPISLISYPET